MLDIRHPPTNDVIIIIIKNVINRSLSSMPIFIVFSTVGRFTSLWLSGIIVFSITGRFSSLWYSVLDMSGTAMGSTIFFCFSDVFSTVDISKKDLLDLTSIKLVLIILGSRPDSFLLVILFLGCVFFVLFGPVLRYLMFGFLCMIFLLYNRSPHHFSCSCINESDVL